MLRRYRFVSLGAWLGFRARARVGVCVCVCVCAYVCVCLKLLKMLFCVIFGFFLLFFCFFLFLFFVFRFFLFCIVFPESLCYVYLESINGEIIFGK